VTPDEGIPVAELDPGQKFPVRNEYWHSTAVIKKSLASYWACVKQFERPTLSKADPTSTGPSLEKPALWRWAPPEMSRMERLTQKFAKYRIWKDHAEPGPNVAYTRLRQDFLIWISKPDNDERFLKAYKAWVARVDDDTQHVPPPPGPRRRGASRPASDFGGTRPILRGGAGTPEPEDDESGDDVPTNGYEGDMPPNGCDCIDCRSRHSALSGYTSDLSRAASEAFHEQNARAAAIGYTSAWHPSSRSLSMRPGEDSDDISRRRFSFDTMPTSGSRSDRTSSYLDDAMGIACSRRESSSMDDGAQNTSDGDNHFINSPPASPASHGTPELPAPPVINAPSGVPPQGYSYQVTADIPPAERPPTRRRRRDMIRDALNRQLSENITRALRSLLVMGSTEQKLIRRREQ
jgi:hypothetical protein